MRALGDCGWVRLVGLGILNGFGLGSFSAVKRGHGVVRGEFLVRLATFFFDDCALVWNRAALPWALRRAGHRLVVAVVAGCSAAWACERGHGTQRRVVCDGRVHGCTHHNVAVDRPPPKTLLTEQWHTVGVVTLCGRSSPHSKRPNNNRPIRSPGRSEERLPRAVPRLVCSDQRVVRSEARIACAWGRPTRSQEQLVPGPPPLVRSSPRTVPGQPRTIANRPPQSHEDPRLPTTGG